MTDTSSLFRPIKIKNLELPNRVVMAPMTRAFSPKGVPGKNVADYYARRAAADVGLIVTEGTLIRRKSAGENENYPLFWGEEPLAGWKTVVEDVHAAGGKIAPQIWHQGAARAEGSGHFPDENTDSPSGITFDGKQLNYTPTEEDIADMVSAYADAAADAKKLGFDSVEIHGAHGYLIDDFFWDKTNKRTDKYGGDLVGRTRFAQEVIQQVRKAVGDDTAIIFRWSQFKPYAYKDKLAHNPTELEPFLGALVDAGVDILHASQRRFWEPEFADIDGEKGLNLAGWCKKLTGKPVITVGSVCLDNDFLSTFGGQEATGESNIENLIERLERDEFDLVAVGRALLTDPDWATKVKEGRLEEFKPFAKDSLKTLF